MAHVSPAGRQFIANFEGGQSVDGLFRPYQDVAGVWTIGRGHTGPDVRSDMDPLTIEQADTLFARDLGRFEQAVGGAISRNATQGQFDAMVSLAYNVGISAFRDSVLLKKFNTGDLRGAALQFVEWVKAGGAIQRGLVRRRGAEILMFLGLP